MRCYPEHNNILYESVIAQYGWNVKGILAVDSKCFEVKKNLWRQHSGVSLEETQGHAALRRTENGIGPGFPILMQPVHQRMVRHMWRRTL